VHTPEFALEHDPANVASANCSMGITYPVALDNGYATFDNYRNQYWPAEYLIDAQGNVRHISFGEGDYAQTERLLRTLLTQASPSVSLPPPTDVTAGDSYLTAGPDAKLLLHFDAKDAYLVLAGKGTVTASYPGHPTQVIHVTGTPDSHPVLTSPRQGTGLLTITLSPGLQANDLTFG
jgi:hypothetical protein